MLTKREKISDIIYFLLNLYLTLKRNYQKNCEARIKRTFIFIIKIINVIEDYFIMFKIFE